VTPLGTRRIAGIGKRIREVRGYLSQDEFCKHLGLPKRTLIRYESEETPPSAEILWSICDVFDIDPRWLLFGNDQTRQFSIPHTAKLAK